MVSICTKCYIRLNSYILFLPGSVMLAITTGYWQKLTWKLLEKNHLVSTGTVHVRVIVDKMIYVYTYM